ncbi:outer membrane beta-barrel protein [Bradyrhizobium pachyrhizi]|nr:outer membrane beta-barrel protein [Bradyrhizobium pachyrhizi]WFU54657.1 outer membrane beta-barrel protein [Bradyrhizobium pachyrhizi]
MRSGVRCWAAVTVAILGGGAANTADLEPTVKLPSALWSWSGGYVGAHVGGGYGRTSFSNPYGPSIYGDVVDTPAFLAGGQIGYNWQNNSWVFGVELDASRAISDGTNSCLAASGIVVSANCKASPAVFVAGTGRVGYAFGPQGRTVAYLKGGVAWQNNRGDVVNNNEYFGFMSQETTHFDYGRVGGIVGLGVEQALTPAWSVKFEYDYLQFGGPSVATAPTVQFPPLAILPANTTSLSSSYQIGRLALNYHFGADPRATQWFDPPLYAKATDTVRPIAYTAGWSFEGGSRLWLSRGRFQWDNSAVPSIPGDPSILESRLTYHELDGLSGELFGRLDSPWGIFLKGYVGTGRFNSGKMNDEDWGIEGRLSYIDTISGQANGRFTYYTADAGYDLLRGTNYKVSGFIGWTYYGQNSDTPGCVQLANSSSPCLAPGDHRIVGNQDTHWNAPRIGVSGETMFAERWRVSADVAYLPWTDFSGRDNHLLRPTTTFFDQRGNGGGGVQIEGVFSYFLTNNFSMGIGGRYWAMWTKKDSDFMCSGCGGPGTIAGPEFAKYSMERWGIFFQVAYKLD